MADSSAWQDPSVKDAAAPNPFAAERGSYDTSFWNSDNGAYDNNNAYASMNNNNNDNNMNDNSNNNTNNNNNPNLDNGFYNGNNFNNNAYGNIGNNNNNNIESQNLISNNVYNDNSNNNNSNNIRNSNYSNNNNNNNNRNNNSNKGITHNELDWREENLRRKEAELEERRKRLLGLKDEIENSNYRQDNWPSRCYPVAFHSITQEIPPYARPHMRRMYSLVILTFVTFFWNLCAELAIYITSSGDKDSDILWATVYFVFGVFYAWRLWYRQIYYGLRDRKTLKWWSFFVFFIVHIGFAGYMAIGIENGSGAAGFILMFDTLQKNAGAGLCNLIAAVLWTIVVLASIFLLKRSWNLYRQKGGLEQARAEFTQEAARQVIAHQTQSRNDAL